MAKPLAKDLHEELRKKRIEDFRNEYIALTQKYGIDFEPFLDANPHAIRANIRLVEIKKEDQPKDIADPLEPNEPEAEVKDTPLSPTEGEAKKEDK